MSRSDKGRLAQLAAQQQGCFTTRQAADCGVSPSGLATLFTNGEIVRPHTGVYRFAWIPPRWEAEISAAVLAGGANAVASHRAAQRLHGLSRAQSGAPLEISKLGAALPLLRGVVVHRTRELSAADRTTRQQIAVTSATRTIIDSGALLSRPDTIALVDEAICAGITARAPLLACAQRLHQGRPGVRAILDVTHEGAEGVFWSTLERNFAGLLRRHDLPTPEFNAAIKDPAGSIGYADALFRPDDLVVELHGLRFHRTPEQTQHDADKLNRYSLSGLRCLVFTWLDVEQRPLHVVDQLRVALGYGSRRAAG